MRRRVVVGIAVTAIAVEGLWLAIHHVPGVGPALADGVRAVLGPAPVAWAEDTAYGIADQVNRWRYGDAPPKTFWEAPPEAAAQAAAVKPAEAAAQVEQGPTRPASVTAATPPAGGAEFPPPSYSPPFENVAAKGDGVWLSMGSRDTAGGGGAVMYKSLVHPDPKRGFAAVAVVAVDLRRLDLHLVSGLQEPFSITVAKERRRGLVAKEDAATLVAAFNGGFKATHGHYGMMIDGETYLPPRDTACTVALYRDGGIRIGTWPNVKDSEAEMAAYRQTPPCLVEQGELNAALSEYNKSWGTTVSGETIIRRSAVGIDKSGQTLFYALGEAVTAQALGRALKAAGAEGAAQLDVNHAYPRFLTYERRSASAPPEAASALIPGIEWGRWDYTVEPSPRDFFYLTRSRGSS